LGAFWTSLSLGIKAITDLIPIHLHIQKLNGRFHLRVYSLLANHITKSLLEARPMDDSKTHQILLEWLTPKQQLNIKSPIMDIDNRFNKILPSFSPLNHKFLLGNRLIDILPNHFLFHYLNRKSKNSIKNHIHNLENITLQALSDSYMVVVELDTSIRNCVATLIVYVHTIIVQLSR